MTSCFHWGTGRLVTHFNSFIINPLKQKSHELENKEKHLDTDSESNHHCSTALPGARTERLHLMIMRTITLIIIHCPPPPRGGGWIFETCRRDHIRHRGFTDIGISFLYHPRRRDSPRTRPFEKVGAHCRNFHNRHSIGICYEVDSAEHTCRYTRTLMQKGSLLALLPNEKPFVFKEASFKDTISKDDVSR